MSTISDKALLLRIRSGEKLESLISRVMQTNEVSESVLNALDDRIKKERITWEELVPYLKQYSRKALVGKLWERQVPSQFVTAELLRVGYNGDAIEEELCRELYETFNGRGLGIYSYIFEAMSERGGPKSLEMLEIIKHDLDAELTINRIVADGILEDHVEENPFAIEEAKQLIKVKFLIGFSEGVESTIEKLHKRGVQLAEEHPSSRSTVSERSSGRDGRVHYYMMKAKVFLPQHPAEALNNMRKAVEAICKDILDEAVHSLGGNRKPARAFSSLEDMISRIRKDGLVPSSIANCLTSLQSFGNFASHDQEEDPESVSFEMAEATFGHLKTVAEWYEKRNI